MERNLARRWRLGAPLLAFALVLTACTGTQDDDEEAVGQVADDAGEDVDAAPAADETDDEDEEEEEEPDLVAGSEDDDASEDAEPGSGPIDQCLVGVWDIDNDSFASYLESVSDDPAFGASAEVVGRGYYTFDADGQFVRENDEFGFTAGDPSMQLSTISNSAFSGDYSIETGDGGVHFLGMVKTEDIVNDTVVKIGDMVQTVDDGDLNVTILDVVHGEAPPMPFPSVDTVVPVTCEGDLVTVELEGGYPVSWNRSG